MKRLKLPTPKRGKFVAVLLVVAALYFVINDAAGSAEAVQNVTESVRTFSAGVSGGGQS